MLHVILICEIVRYITYPKIKYTSSCTFPKGIGSINVIVIWENGPAEVHKFELNPDASITVFLFTQNET